MNKNQLIAPIDLRDYLKSQGWTVLDEALGDRLYLLQNSSFSGRQLIFPMDMTAPDYRESLSTVLEKLAELTNQNQDNLAAMVKSLKDDVLRLRIYFDGNDSALPLSFAGTLVQYTEKLLKAAACTVLRPRIHHPRLSLSEASQFVEKARFQQTEEGSFILKVACPLNAMDIQGNLDFDGGSLPFVRQVTQVLQRSLFELTSAIENDKLDNLVDELKKEGAIPFISSNLCEAIVGMHDERIDNCLDIGFDWSVLHPVSRSVPTGLVRIQRDYFSRIEEVRRELRSIEQNEENTFIGTVERLDGELGAHGQRSGDVILAILLQDEGETVRAKITLQPDDYVKADKAHMASGAYVQITGLLRPGRQPRQLTNVTRFELIDKDTLSSS